jgi:Uma2 family endonuclease
MSHATKPADANWPWGVPVPPSGDELPYDDGEPMETELHRKQMDFTLDYAEWLLRDRDAYATGNMALYYSALQAKALDFKAPDIMIMLDVPRRVRKSWVMWEEDGKGPDVVIELLSETTSHNDLGRKKDIYERVLRVPEYFVYDPLSKELRGWRLETADGYRPIVPDESGRLASHRLGVSLGEHEGTFRGATTRWLRFFFPDGSVVPTHAEAEKQRAEAEKQRAADAEAEVVRLKNRLAELER